MKIISSPRTIGVCGIGQIGLALGLACWRAGFRVWIYGRNEQKLSQAQRDLERMNAWMASEFPDDEPRFGELHFTSDLAPLNREAELVVEGIAETLPSKVELFQALEGVRRAAEFFAAAPRGSVFQRWAGNPVIPLRSLARISGIPLT